MEISDMEPRVEDVCGPGVDTSFDQLISALGHIARQKPRPLIDTIMYWRKAKGEEATSARSELNQVSLTLFQTRTVLMPFSINLIQCKEGYQDEIRNHCIYSIRKPAR